MLTNATLTAVFAAAYFRRERYPRGAWILFAAVLSHWLRDVIVHPPDMALAPGVPVHLGLGLWTSIAATLVVEGGFWLLAIIFYVRATHPRKRVGAYAFWSIAALLTLIWYSNIAGPPPNPRTMPIASLIFFTLVVAWAYWMNQLRPTRS